LEYPQIALIPSFHSHTTSAIYAIRYYKLFKRKPSINRSNFVSLKGLLIVEAIYTLETPKGL
jgi:hypothetical protein